MCYGFISKGKLSLESPLFPILGNPQFAPGLRKEPFGVLIEKGPLRPLWAIQTAGKLFAWKHAFLSIETFHWYFYCVRLLVPNFMLFTYLNKPTEYLECFFLFFFGTIVSPHYYCRFGNQHHCISLLDRCLWCWIGDPHSCIWVCLHLSVDICISDLL